MKKSHIDADVVKRFVESAKTDVAAALVLLSSSGSSHSAVNAICSFWFAVEKMVRLNLYVRSPLLLKKDPNAGDLLIEVMPHGPDFGVEYVVGLKDTAVSFSKAWERLKHFMPKLGELDLYKNEIVNIRNEHAHSFSLKPHSLALEKASADVWKILESVCEGLDYVHDGTYKTPLARLCPNKSTFKRAQAQIKTFDLERLFTRVKERNLKLIKARKIVDYEDFAKVGGGFSAEYHVPVVCPVCETEQGHVGFSLDWDFPVDNEGDMMHWGGPSQYYASFENFACTNCGTYVESKSILSDLNYETDSLEPDLSIGWSDEDRIVAVEKYEHGDPSDPFEGSSVDWL